MHNTAYHILLFDLNILFCGSGSYSQMQDSKPSLWLTFSEKEIPESCSLGHVSLQKQHCLEAPTVYLTNATSTSVVQ